ncbi:hypothetical protein DFH09DRAFT_1168081 [Mycena vulgaris]|nr:hypothetical protein DFH09DRAFT_1168081 [Mycena vulgaris]
MRKILSVVSFLAAGVVSTLDAKPAFGCTTPPLAHHLYGMNMNILLTGNGWTYQALAAFVFATQEESTIPLHHMVNPTTFDRIYTTNTTEVNVLEKNGYGTAALEPLYYIYPTQICGSVPFYRLSKLALHDHFFTASEIERIESIESQGYADEGIAGYVFAPEPSQC